MDLFLLADGRKTQVNYKKRAVGAINCFHRRAMAVKLKNFKLQLSLHIDRQTIHVIVSLNNFYCYLCCLSIEITWAVVRNDILQTGMNLQLELKNRNFPLTFGKGFYL